MVSVSTSVCLLQLFCVTTTRISDFSSWRKQKSIRKFVGIRNISSRVPEQFSLFALCSTFFAEDIQTISLKGCCIVVLSAHLIYLGSTGEHSSWESLSSTVDYTNFPALPLNFPSRCEHYIVLRIAWISSTIRGLQGILIVGKRERDVISYSIIFVAELLE